MNRHTRMKIAPLLYCLLGHCLLALVPTARPAVGQTRDAGPWWPHQLWGPGDQAGGSNWITPEKILDAISLVKTGKVYELGHVYERGMPLIGDRTFSMYLNPGEEPVGPNLIANDDFLSTNIGQIGTQFDAPGHIGKRMRMADGTVKDVYYNGFTADEIRSPYGLLKLGVENVNAYITRGILIDVAGYKGVERLPDDYAVTLADVRGALSRQGLTEDAIKPGDALLFNFGWWRLWPDEKSVGFNWPGIGPEVAGWVVARKASMIGSDAATDEMGSWAVHHELIVKHGILNLEFMDFRGLLADEVYEFMFIFTPLRMKGATGSPARPLAIR